MSLKRKLLMGTGAFILPLATTGILLAVTTGVASAKAPPEYNNVNDTVQCAGITGTLTVNPGLTGGTPSPTTGTVKGEVWGCQDGNAAISAKDVPSDPIFDGKLAGTLSLSTNALTALTGCETIGGSLTITWSATSPYVTGTTTENAKLMDPTTVLSPTQESGQIWQPAVGNNPDVGFDQAGVGSAGYPLGTGTGTDGYGSFLLGSEADSPGSCTGPDGTLADGFSSGGVTDGAITTGQDSAAFIAGEENSGSPLAYKSIIDIGIGELYLG